MGNEYTIESILIVSKSLLNQQQEDFEQQKNLILKAVLKENKKIVYFLDALCFGIGTVIKTDNLTNILYPCQYSIVKNMEYIHDKCKINRLLELKKQ